MRKILMITNNLSGGGAEMVTEYIANYLAEKGYSVDLLALATLSGDRRRYDQRIQVISVVHPGIGDGLAGRLRYKARQAFRLLAASVKRYDAVLVMKEGLYLRLAHRFKARKKICWIHSDYNYDYWTGSFYRSREHERKCMADYDHIVCVSDLVRLGILKHVGDPGNLCVRYNPIDAASIWKKAVLPAELPESRGMVFVTVSRLSREKALHRVLECCSRICTETPYTVWIVGDGQERAALEKYRDDHRLDNVSFLGWKDNPYPYILHADCFISSSESESYGLVVQESLILGTRVLACDLPVFQELKVDKNCRIIENSARGLQSGMEQMLKEYQEGKVAFADGMKNRETKEAEMHRELYLKRLRAIEELISDQYGKG